MLAIPHVCMCQSVGSFPSAIRRKLLATIGYNPVCCKKNTGQLVIQNRTKFYVVYTILLEKPNVISKDLFLLVSDNEICKMPECIHAYSKTLKKVLHAQIIIIFLLN